VKNILRTIAFLAAAAVLLRYWALHRREAAAVAASVRGDANGFAPLPPVFEPPPERLLILAPPNCPREAGRRADELASLLQNDGIPYTRSGNINIIPSRQPTSAEMDQLNRTMLGELPIVFIGGRARNNPTTDELLAEYRQTR
jgi:hypothetical protein